jgi:uncharacterized lipoprotein YmbA
MSASSPGLACLALTLVLAAGCAPTPASRLYLLQVPEEAAQGPAGDPGPIIFVDPAVVATYADRTQLVTRMRDGSVLLDEFDGWAEPPGEQVTAVLVDSLAARFGAEKVLATPRQRDLAPDYRIAVDVLRLHADHSGNAVVDARWALFAGSKERFVGTSRERLVEPIVGTGDVPARIAAFERALGRLADRLARAIHAEVGNASDRIAAPQLNPAYKS